MRKEALADMVRASKTIEDKVIIVIMKGEAVGNESASTGECPERRVLRGRED